MKQKLLKNSLLLFLSGIIIVSCTLEKDALEEHEHRKLTEQRISLYEIPGLQSKINARIQANKSMNRGGEIDYLELLNPDNVLLIEEENGNKHYTFSLNMQENNTLTNVVIKQVGTEIDYKVIEYASPDIEQWLIDNIDNGYSNITPTISNRGDGSECYLYDVRCPDPDFRHQLSDGECTYDASEFIITVTPFPCGPGSEGGNFDHFGDVGDGSSNTGSPSDNNYGSGGNNNTTFTNPNPPCDPRVDCPLFDQETNPCTNLKKHLSISDGIKLKSPGMYDFLTGKLNQTQEYGFYFKKEDDVYTPYPSYNAVSDKITIKVGENYFCSIHTHPYPAGNPMFSWEDVYSLQQYFQLVDPSLQQEVTVFLVCKDPNGVNQLYALKIDDFTLFSDMLIADISETVLPKDLEGLNTEEQVKEILRLMNAKQHKYNQENFNINQEVPFLNYFANANISLYKANDGLTNWDKLTLSNNPTEPITKTPCN